MLVVINTPAKCKSNNIPLGVIGVMLYIHKMQKIFLCYYTLMQNIVESGIRIECAMIISDFCEFVLFICIIILSHITEGIK